jgi:cytochrome c-type biogenesis protein
VDADSVTILVAFAAGTLSFLSPCVVPLVPAYVGYITGLTSDELGRERAGNSAAVLVPAFAFVLGLSAVLSILGLGVTAAGQLLADYQSAMSRIGGAVVIVLGLHTAGVVRIPLLYRESRVDLQRFRGRGALGALLMGAAFAVGWTPCIGAILGGILTLASQSETVGRGTALLFAYSIGLGIPFLLVALGIRRAVRVLTVVKRNMRLLEWISGGLLVVMGILLFTDQMILITAWFTKIFGNGLAL